MRNLLLSDLPLLLLCSTPAIIVAIIMATSKITTSMFPCAWKSGKLPHGIGARTREPLFDALTITAHELQALLVAKTLKSTDIVKEFVWRIEEYNPYLNAVFEYAPGVLQRASELDVARANGQFLGPLHGIPILLKVSFCVDARLSWLVLLNSDRTILSLTRHLEWRQHRELLRC